MGTPRLNTRARNRLWGMCCNTTQAPLPSFTCWTESTPTPTSLLRIWGLEAPGTPYRMTSPSLLCWKHTNNKRASLFVFYLSRSCCRREKKRDRLHGQLETINNISNLILRRLGKNERQFFFLVVRLSQEQVEEHENEVTRPNRASLPCSRVARSLIKNARVRFTKGSAIRPKQRER